jgi:RIO-like serine/threonine protein kinase
MTVLKPMKIDIFGKIELAMSQDGRLMVIRDWRGSNIFLKPIAFLLAAREKKIITCLESLNDRRIPKPLYFGKGTLIRSYIEGSSLKESRIQDQSYYREARQLLDRIHAMGVVHNDLEKPENWLVTEDASPAIIDFQLACFFPKKGILFKIAAREDMRHLVKQKARFCPASLSGKDKEILRRKSNFTRIWSRIVKPVYNFITRKILRYSDRLNSMYSR